MYPLIDPYPVPKPFDGDGASYCLEKFMQAYNDAYKNYEDAYSAAKDDDGRVLALLAYTAAYNAAIAAYGLCMGVVPSGGRV